MEQYRLVATPEGPITYRLVKKRVKNLNLRLDRAGEVVLSVPLRCPTERADAFVIEKSGWIVGHLPRPEGDVALATKGGRLDAPKRGLRGLIADPFDT